LELLTKSHPCTTLVQSFYPKKTYNSHSLEKEMLSCWCLEKTQAAMTQPNLSNGESVKCIKKLDMYNTTDQETWSMCFGVVINV
jgi:hypothetical protein